MSSMGFVIGMMAPCMYHHPERHVCCERHGDDFIQMIVLGTRPDQRWFRQEVGKHMILKLLGVLGPCKDEGDVQELIVLNKLVRYVQPPYASDDSAYIEWEPDPRHVEILRKTVCLEGEGVKKLSSPGVRHGTD
eukprot:2547535-Amphidinium_carterae.1